MGAFEKIKSGIPQMDKELDYIRFGDNVVWQVTSLEEFDCFVTPFVKQAKIDKRNIIYIRFASHDPFVEAQEGVTIYEVELSHRFETFTVEIHNIIEKEGVDACYIFDCLSELQVAWSTDLMMSNFFKLTCPYLFQLDTVAYFPILRGRHSFEAIAKIRETTQLLLDVYSEDSVLYVHPLKVWNRYSQMMFLPHSYRTDMVEFLPLTDGVSVSKFYSILNRISLLRDEQDIDSWDHFFNLAKAQYMQGDLHQEIIHKMCRTMMTRDTKLRSLIEDNFMPEDFFTIRSRMIGTGMIGGKSCGMLLARKLVEKNLPHLNDHLESHDSFFVGSDVFYTYIVQNDCWKLRIKQRTEEGYFSVAEEFGDALKRGKFPEDIREQFRRMLEYFGQSPIIVRSSSILEDGFGNAFAGKYDSVFCVNMGSLEERLQDFEDAVRTVYASTMNPSALEYRKRRNLAGRDEQMSLLVQRVSGSYYDSIFMPSAAGVGYSYTAYRFTENMDMKKGMLRIVMGLGTKAVDRTVGDYPRLISLEDPMAVIHPKISDRHRYSQHKIDVLDIKQGIKDEKSLSDIIPMLPSYVINNLLEHDTDAEYLFRERGQNRDIYFISCSGLAKKDELISMMNQILSTLQSSYDYPVDIEYTINLGEGGSFVVNLLQCRPLQTCISNRRVEIPTFMKEKTLFHLEKVTMGRSREQEIDIVVMVDPLKYYNYPYKLKTNIARSIGRINQYYKQQKKKIMLIVPGRIGTSSPELGIPVVFADISEFDVVCEVAFSKAGYMPELSFGSHMFQDLVESDILYGAIFENSKTILYQPELLNQEFNIFKYICPEDFELEDMIKVCHIADQRLMLFHDMEDDHTICGYVE